MHTRARRSRSHRLVRSLPAVLLPVSLLSVSACSLLGGGPSAEDEAADVARALSAGRLTTLSVAGATPAQAQRLWTSSTEGLGDVRPSVRVLGVEEGDGGTATARLAYTWRLAASGRPWTYVATARLRKGGDDVWSVLADPTLLHPDLRSGEQLLRTSTAAPRADILGVGGARLVTARPVQRLGVDKTQVGPAQQLVAARWLARHVGIAVGPYVARVRAAAAKAFVEAIVLRDRDGQAALDRGAASKDGVAVVRDRVPLAPTRDFARPVLGTVGPVTAEVVAASHGAYRAGDEAGLSGLESRYDEQLRGTPGVAVVAVGSASRRLFHVDPVAGRPLRTTLDPRLQRLAEAALSDVRPASALVAIRPSTGDLLAVASGAGSDGYSTATLGHYAPGSTFKVVSSLALLRAGVRPSSLLRCPPTTVVDGKRFSNYSDYPAAGLGRIPLSTAVADSCNTAFVNEGRVVSQGDLADAAAGLGLGVDHDLGFPAYFGSVPGMAAESVTQTGHAASMIGQGEVVASPMAMAAVAASVADGGVVVPRLLPTLRTGGQETSSSVTPAESAQLRALMRGVVTRGSASFLGDLPGAPVLAKTGTAEFGDARPPRTHAWMIAVHGDLAVAVFIDVGESGSGTAGPVLERFLRGAG